MRKRVKSPIFIEMVDIKDLGRFACALERVPIPIFSIKYQDMPILATQGDLYRGISIFYFTKIDKKGHFIGYRNMNGIEDVIITSSSINPSYMYSPIIYVKKLPKIFTDGFNNPRYLTDKFLSVEVEDLASLAKICSYKILFEEPPLPLFQFPVNDKWYLGAFTRVDDSDEVPLFFYATLLNPTDNAFLKFYSQKMDDIGFTNKIDEHGYIFIKIIKLYKIHPMIQFE